MKIKFNIISTLIILVTLVSAGCAKQPGGPVYNYSDGITLEENTGDIVAVSVQRVSEKYDNYYDIEECIDKLQNVNGYIIYDIEYKGANGKKATPAGAMNVTFDIPKLLTCVNGTTFKLYYFNGSELDEIPITITVDKIHYVTDKDGIFLITKIDADIEE